MLFVNHIFRDPNAIDIVIIIDDLSQIDSLRDPILSWLPSVLPPQIKLILSTDTASLVAGILLKRYSKAALAGTPVLEAEAQKSLMKEMIRLKGDTIKDVEISKVVHTSKRHTEKPTWVYWASEIISLLHLYSMIYIEIPESIDGAIGAYINIIEKNEAIHWNFIRAALCLLAVSKSGLTEVELQRLLQHKEIFQLFNESKETEKEQQVAEQLPIYHWFLVHEKLRPFLAENSGDLLRFRQESWRRHVGSHFFHVGNGKEDPMAIANQWRQLLINYFEEEKNIKFGRKCQILLEIFDSMKNYEKMARLLQKWQTFAALFDPFYSDKLINYWANFSDMRKMCLHYSYLYELRQTKYSGTEHEEKLREDCFKVASLWKQCGFFDAAAKFYENLCFRNEGSKLHHNMRLVDVYQIQYEISLKLSKRGEEVQIDKAIRALKKQKLLLDLLQAQGMKLKFF